MTEGTTLADKLHPNWSLARSWGAGGRGAKNRLRQERRVEEVQRKGGTREAL